MSTQNETQPSCFDEYMGMVAQRKPFFTAAISRFPMEFVFRHTRDWEDYRQIREKATNQVKAIREGTILETWKPFIGSDLVVVLRAVNMAERHVGFRKADPIEDGKEPTFTDIQEAWGTLQFLQMSVKDPHGFQALTDALDAHIASGWQVDDLDYFQRDASPA